MRVDLIDLKKRYEDEREDLLNIFDNVLKNGSLVLTDEVKNFENNIAKYTGAKFCVGLNSGTDALMMSLWALGITKGDEVITSPVSFIASVGAIVHVGAKPIFVDIKEDLNINEELIENAITDKTKAIMPVHWSGKICNMDKINAIAKKNNLLVIEDAAQGMGSYYNNRHSGTFGNIASFSAHPLKNLNAVGDAGFVVTDSEELNDKIRLYRNHGMESRDNVKIFGVNSRLDSLHAEILTYRLKKLKSVINQRRNNIEIYKRYIKTKKVILPNDNPNSYDSYVMFITLSEKRNELQKFLASKNIQSLIYYGTPLHLHKASKVLGYKKGDFKMAEELCDKVISFPHHQYLSEEQIKFVSDSINLFYN